MGNACAPQSPPHKGQSEQVAVQQPTPAQRAQRKKLARQARHNAKQDQAIRVTSDPDLSTLDVDAPFDIPLRPAVPATMRSTSSDNLRDLNATHKKLTRSRSHDDITTVITHQQPPIPW